MAVNEAFAGRTYPLTEPFSVGREHIRDFAAAVGATDPVHHDVEAARAAGNEKKAASLEKDLATSEQWLATLQASASKLG